MLSSAVSSVLKNLYVVSQSPSQGPFTLALCLADRAVSGALSNPWTIHVYNQDVDWQALRAALPWSHFALCTPPSVCRCATSGVRGEWFNCLLTATACSQRHCDQGTLREAIKRGTFHRAMAGGMLGVDVRSVVEVRCWPVLGGRSRCPAALRRVCGRARARCSLL